MATSRKKEQDQETDPLISKDNPQSDTKDPTYQSMTETEDLAITPAETPFKITVTEDDKDLLNPADNPFAQPISESKTSTNGHVRYLTPYSPHQYTSSSSSPAVSDTTSLTPKGWQLVPQETKTTPPALSSVDKKALNLLQDIHDQMSPWNGWRKYLSFLIALYGATSTSSSTHHFANILLRGRGGLIAKVLVDLAAAPPTFALSFNSNIATWNRVMRTLSHASAKDFKRNSLPVIITAISAVTSFQVNWLGLENLNQTARIVLSTGRAFSALGTNGLFATKTFKSFRGLNDGSKPMQVLLDAHDKLLKLARAKEGNNEFIKALSQSKLFECLSACGPDSHVDGKEQVNNLFNALFLFQDYQTTTLSNIETAPAEMKKPEAKPNNSRFSKRKIAVTFAGVLGGLTGLMYYNYGTSVPHKLFELQENPLMEYGVGSLFGVASCLVNAAINSTLLSAVVGKAIDISTNEGLYNHFWRDKTLLGRLFLLPLLYTIVGSSFAIGGMALEKPVPIDNAILGWVEAIVSLCVQAAISSASIDKFLTTVQDYRHRDLLVDLNAALKEGTSMETHFSKLSTEDHGYLSRIILDYLDGAFAPIKDFFNDTTTEINDALFSPEIKAKLNAFVYSNAPKSAVTAALPTHEHPDNGDVVGALPTAAHLTPSKVHKRRDLFVADPATAAAYMTPNKSSAANAIHRLGLNSNRTTPNKGIVPPHTDVEMPIQHKPSN